jgi:hypothetical protein
MENVCSEENLVEVVGRRQRKRKNKNGEGEWDY